MSGVWMNFRMGIAILSKIAMGRKSLAAMTTAIALVPSMLSAQGTFINETLIEETANFDIATWRPLKAKDLPNFGEMVAVSPQNRGVLLYADDTIAIFNRANVRTNEKSAGGKPVSRLIPEGRICDAQVWHREWGEGGIRYNVDPVQVPSMRVVAVINKPPTFEISEEWFGTALRPIVQDKLVDKFCGGKAVSVVAEVWLAGLQHSSEGEVFNIAEFEYPSYPVGDDARRRFSVEVNSATRSLRIKPLNAGFATGNFLFWENLSSGDRKNLAKMGFHGGEETQAQASIGYGVSEFENGRIKTLNKKWERLSYADYNWHLAQSAKRTRDVLAARQEAEELAKAFISGIAILQFRNYCYGNDTPWWAWDLHDVWGRRELDACKHYFAN